jgi:putative sigma-54 modulation protein
VLRGVSSGATPIAAIDTLLDKLERQVIRAKTKPRRQHLREADETQDILAREGLGSIATDEEVAPTQTPSVMRIKRFDMVPMFEEDAIARMQELGHEFFVFLNAENERICVVYARRDGTYGLIEPVVGDRR